MAANDEPLSCFEMSASISVCGLLFILAFSELGHLAWAIPAMILFSLAGLGLLSALLSGSEEATPVVP
jgi:predicted benzoate:H+ symporter BenE